MDSPYAHPSHYAFGLRVWSCNLIALAYFSGEVLKMTHIARGLDENGVLQVDVILNGQIPEFPEVADIQVLPYTEDYIQTGPGGRGLPLGGVDPSLHESKYLLKTLLGIVLTLISVFFSGSIYAYSSRIFRVNGRPMPYAWNHTITYDPDLGNMPYLLQTLSVDDIFVDFDISNDILKYQLKAAIAQGEKKHETCTE